MTITDYSFGSIDIDGKTYRSDVIVTPGRVIDSWWRREGHQLQVEDLEEVISASPETVVIGTGYYGRMAVPEATLAYLRDRGISTHVAETREAVKLFNTLARKSASVVAALHLTC